MVHGIAASITLAKVMEINFDSIIENDKLLQAFGVSNCQRNSRAYRAFPSTIGFLKQTQRLQGQ